MGEASNKKLAGKVAIVTGAAQGIGAHYAKGYAEAGAKVLVSDVLDVSNTVGIINQAGGEAIGTHCDVTDDTQIKAMTDEALGKWGQIDILMNNAALFGNLPHNKFEDIPMDEWDKVMTVNVRSIWQCIKAVSPHMRERQYGKIINVSSGTVFKGTPWLAHYVSSKGAVIALTRAIARELGDDNICVNSIAPGLTESENVLANDFYTDSRAMRAATRSLKRGQVPEDLVGTAIFLASDDSDFMTGQTICVDGGASMH